MSSTQHKFSKTLKILYTFYKTAISFEVLKKRCRNAIYNKAATVFLFCYPVRFLVKYKSSSIQLGIETLYTAGDYFVLLCLKYFFKV